METPVQTASTYAIDPDRALPTVAYRSKEVFDIEQQRIWRNSWVWVASEDELSTPGDFVTTTLGGQPVIVLRNQDGELAAMSNMCAHRGTLLADGAGNTKRFQCPYHAWTFRDDGTLMSIPHANPGDVDKEAHCLPTYRCETWHGLVFVSINPDVTSLAERYAHIEQIAVDRGLGRLSHWSSQRETQEWNANWKLIMMNAMESYHLFKVHPETLEPYTPTSGAYYITGNADAAATGGSQKGDDDYVLFSMPPNLVGVLTSASFLYQVVEPVTATRSRVIAGGAFTATDPEDSGKVTGLLKKATARATQSLIPDFLPEDKAICERGQQAASGDFNPGTLVPMEQVITDFHHYLNHHTNNIAPPPTTWGLPSAERPGLVSGLGE